MTTSLIVHWVLWGTALLAAAGAIGAIFKLRLAERALPAWSEFKEINSRLALLREEQQQAGAVAASYRQELAELEAQVGFLRELSEWQAVHPDAPAQLQQLAADLDRTSAELSATQQQRAEEEARRSEIVRHANRLQEENAQLTEQILGLRQQVGSLEKQKEELDAQLPRLREEHRQAAAAAASHRQELTELENQVAPLRQLREWQAANPDAPARLQQLMTDLERASAELSSLEQNLQRLQTENAQRTEEAVGLQKQVAVLAEQKREMAEQLPQLREEQRQAAAAAATQRAALAKLESELEPLRQLRAWHDANPGATVRLQRLMTDLDRAKAELAAVQHQRAQEETHRCEIVQDANRLREESAQPAGQAFALCQPVGSLEEQKPELAQSSAEAASPPAKKKRKARRRACA